MAITRRQFEDMLDDVDTLDANVIELQTKYALREDAASKALLDALEYADEALGTVRGILLGTEVSR